MQNKIINNVEYILEQYGKHIKNDRQLILLYWQKIDNVEMDKETISTKDFMSRASNPVDIVNAKVMLGLMGNK
jgi:hypothetical protein